MELDHMFLGSLNRLFNEILTMEQKVILRNEYSNLTNNDLRVINAIGIDQPKNMSMVAKAMSVTVGTLTIAINNLVKKGYVLRVRSTEDRRVVLLSLSASGRDVYRMNKKFHEEMAAAAVEGLDEEQCRVLENALTNLYTFLKEQG
ncbi:MAG: MarR family transcriptional regulator [Lachnospiraceae bacterium]|nr:MarR family transcriptional regulator [Lachnospiraceae bacterium]